MASGGVSRSSSRQTSCTICLEPFRGRCPKLLPCFHTFCSPCLTLMAETATPKMTRSTNEDSSTDIRALEITITCPTCRKDVTVPPKGVTQFQSNFYLDQEEDQGHLQPMLCDLCDQGQVASHMCTRCQMKLCFHCHRIHGDCSVVAGSSQGKAGVTSDGDVNELLEKGKSQVTIMEKMLTRMAEDEKALHMQKKSLEDNLHARYAEGLTKLADARDAVLRSIREKTEAIEETFKTEVAAVQKKFDVLLSLTSRGDKVSTSMAELQASMLSDADVSRYKDRVDEEKQTKFFRLKSVETRTADVVKSLQELLFGTLEICQGAPDLSAHSFDVGDFDSEIVYGKGDHQQTSEASQSLLTEQSSKDSGSMKTKLDDLVQKMESLTKKVTESENQGRKLQGENRALMEETRTFQDKSSILVQEVASLQAENGKLREEMSKLQSGYQTLAQDYTTVQKQSTKLSTNFADLQKEVHGLQNERNPTPSAAGNVSMRQEVDAVNKISQLLKTRVESSQDQIKLLQRQVKNLQESVTNAVKKTEFSNLQAIIGKLRKHVAFHAYLHTNVRTRSPRTLVCKEIVTNIGEGYCGSTGIFTAPVSGTYIFLATVSTNTEKEAVLSVVLEDTEISFASCNTQDTGNTCHVTAHVNAGQRVFMKTWNKLSTYMSGKTTSFSGALVQPATE